MISKLEVLPQLPADVRRRLSPNAQHIGHFSGTAQPLKGSANFTFAWRFDRFHKSAWRELMRYMTSHRATALTLAAALGTVAWSPMAVAAQKAPPVTKGFSIIYQFPINVMNYPVGGVVLDKLGDIFGATYSGGANSFGDVYELVSSGGSYTFADIHDFTGTGDGDHPASGSPYLDTKGNLFLTASQGGAGNAGTAIKLSPSGGAYSEAALFSFGTTNGGQPNASILSNRGTLYTTTYVGGASGHGAIVALSPSTLSEKLLYSFAGLPSDGQSPAANLVADSHGNLYGTTQMGGSGFGTFGSGTVFKFVPTKTGGTETVLWNFGVVTNDGEQPYAPPVVDSAGNIYGTTQFGGGLTHGVVWKLTPSGGSYTESVLYWFGSSNGSTDGNYPMGGLILVGKTLYGTTTGGGATGNGTIFSVSTTGTNYKVLHSFADSDGRTPEFATWSIKSGTLYGTTVQGGIGDTGVVWRFVL
jgi:uncharacterized repeat protein (TIGR03803 family)